MDRRKVIICVCFVFSLFCVRYGERAYAADFDSFYVQLEVYRCYDFASRVLKLTNAQRTMEGLKPLVVDRALTHAAMVRAAEISVYFSHDRPCGRSGDTAVRDYSNKLLGENIAAGQFSPEEVVDDWMNSPSHRENILYPYYQSVGIGVVYDKSGDYKYYWVQVFNVGSSENSSVKKHRVKCRQKVRCSNRVVPVDYYLKRQNPACI